MKTQLHFKITLIRMEMALEALRSDGKSLEEKYL